MPDRRKPCAMGVCLRLEWLDTKTWKDVTQAVRWLNNLLWAAAESSASFRQPRTEKVLFCRMARSPPW